MAKMMVLGIKGEAGLWLVDFEAGTVTAMDGDRSDYIAAGSDDAGSVDVAVPFGVKEGAFSGFLYKGSEVDVAVPFGIKDEAFSGHYYKSAEVDVAVPFSTSEEAFSGHYYKTPVVDGTKSLNS